MLSYWEQTSLLHFDILIIGSGIVGLNTAIDLKEQYPKASIAILERGIMPSGASTRNAGFACFGSLSELIDDLQHTPQQEVYQLYKHRKEGIQLLRQRLGDEAIGFEQQGSHELLTAAEAPLLEHIPELNKMLADLDEQPIFELAHEQIQQFGIAQAHFPYCVAAASEGSIHTGKMMQALIQLAISKGVHIITGAAVSSYEEEEKQVKVWVKDEIRHTEITYNCQQLLICNNAFATQFFPELAIQPGRGQILITQPIQDLKLKGIYHFDHGYYYFRAIDNRVLIGGGRNIDFEGERTTAFAPNKQIEQAIMYYLKEAILPNQQFEIAMQWSGIMAFGPTKSPILHKVSNRVHGAFRLGGMGVALGTQLAKDLSQQIHL